MEKKRKQKKLSDYEKAKQLSYLNGEVNIITEVKKPSYSIIGNWLLERKEGRSVAYDFWARGNYTKRLIHNINSSIEPLIIPFSYLDELKYAYRRLSLIGCPAEYVYIGPHSKFGKVFSLAPPDLLVDAGWGYYGTVIKNDDKPNEPYFCFIGEGLYMPDDFFDWLVEEAYQDFIDGKLFISNGELIGISKKNFKESINGISEITGGASLMQSSKQTQLIMELDIPFIDNMSSNKYLMFLENHESDLVIFRRAFKNLFNEDLLNDSTPIEELQYEIAEIQNSSKYNNFRNTIKKLGGVLTVFTISAALLDPTIDKSLTKIIAAAGAGAATKTLLDIYHQVTNSKQNINKSSFSLMWDLGIKRPSHVIRKTIVSTGNLKNPLFNNIKLHEAHHWLCPPTPGFRIVAVKKED